MNDDPEMSPGLSKINKEALLEGLKAQVSESLSALRRRQMDTQKAATHEENRPEHSKDTRATEQSYLARGLAVRVDELDQALTQLAKLEPKAFGKADSIRVMALAAIRVDNDAEAQVWWLVPAAGGLEMTHGGLRIRSITPRAPLGRAMIGLYAEDEDSFSTPRGKRSFEVLEIA